MKYHFSKFYFFVLYSRRHYKTFQISQAREKKLAQDLTKYENFLFNLSTYQDSFGYFGTHCSQKPKIQNMVALDTNVPKLISRKKLKDIKILSTQCCLRTIIPKNRQ